MDIKIDINENYVLPGLIDCHTHLGIIEEATGKIGVDNNEISDPVTPHAEDPHSAGHTSRQIVFYSHKYNKK